MSLFDEASLVVTPNGVKEGKLYSIKPTDGSGDLNVVRATTATRVNSDGLIEVTPYNLFTYSEQFDNASWVKNNSTIAPNNIVSPNGTLTADKLVENTSNTTHSVIKPFVVTSGVNYNFSVFLKKAERSKALLLFFGGFPTTTFQIDLDNKSISTQTGTPINAFIQEYNDQWFRVGFSLTANSSTSCNFTIYTSIDGLWANRSYLGDGTSGIYIWGAQLEVGTSAKEYFPTTDRLNIPCLDYTNGSCPSILVQPQRTNVLLRSEEFDNAYWINNGATIIANDTTSPDGTTNADRLTATGGGFGIVRFSTWNATNKVASCFVKANTSNIFRIANVSASGGSVTFNLSTLNITATTGFTGTIEVFKDGWFRCTAIDTLGRSGTFSLGVTSVSESVYIWGAQLEAGSYATSYIPTVGSTVTRNSDVISKTGISDLIGQTEGTVFLDANISTRSNTRFLLDLQDGTNNDVFQFVLNGNTLTVNIFDSGILQASLNGGFCLGRKKIALGYKLNDFVLYVDGVQISTDTSGTIPTTSLIALGHLNISSGYELGDSINSTVLYKTRLDNATLSQLTTL